MARARCTPLIAFAGPLGRMTNRGVRATAPIEHIWDFRFSSFVFNYAAQVRRDVSTIQRARAGVTLQPFRASAGP
jgi:hypothetical protein